MIPGEQIVSCLKAARDFVVFIDKRLIAVNVQGIRGINATSLRCL